MTKKKLKVGDQIAVPIIGEFRNKRAIVVTIVEDYNEDQWVVEFVWTLGDYREKVKRYVDK